VALEGAYAFDDVGSATVLDLSGNGRHITLTGTNGAQVNSAGALDGGALGKTGIDTVSLPATLLAATETDDRTLMFDGLGTRSTWWIRWEDAGLDTGVWGALSLDEANVITRARDQANANPTPANSVVGALSDTTRHNFALTYVRATGVLSRYYDGTLVGTQTFTAGTALFVGADDLNVAEWSDAGPAIDNLRFYSHALNGGEVAALAGTPVTAEGDEVLGTATAVLGAPLTTATGVRVIRAVTVAALDALTATGTGRRSVVASSVVGLGALLAVATGRRSVGGTGVAVLGPLRVTATVGTTTTARLRVAGREPRRRVTGREPRSVV